MMAERMCRNKAFLKLLKGTLDQDIFVSICVFIESVKCGEIKILSIHIATSIFIRAGSFNIY